MTVKWQRRPDIRGYSDFPRPSINETINEWADRQPHLTQHRDWTIRSDKREGAVLKCDPEKLIRPHLLRTVAGQELICGTPARVTHFLKCSCSHLECVGLGKLKRKRKHWHCFLQTVCLDHALLLFAAYVCVCVCVIVVIIESTKGH